MPPIKLIKLSRLLELFGLSANDEKLDLPVRKLAARLMTHVAHTMRIDTNVKDLSEQLSQLTDIVDVLAKRAGLPTEQPQEQPAAEAAPQAQARPAQTRPAQSPPQAKAPAPAAKPAQPDANAQPVEEEDEEEAAFQARMMAEAQAEVDAINNAGGIEADVTPLRSGKHVEGAA